MGIYAWIHKIAVNIKIKYFVTRISMFKEVNVDGRIINVEI